MKWKDYLASFPTRHPEFVAKRYEAGKLPSEMMEALRTAILEAPDLPMDASSHIEGSAWAALSDVDIAGLNRNHIYKDLTLKTSAALSKILLSIKDHVAKCLSSPWRVLNVRSWITKPGAETGPNRWHLDGDLHDMLKMMIYSTPTGGEYGGLDVKVDGRVMSLQDQWILFYNSILLHRGVPPRDGLLRVATEVTISPSERFDLAPRFLGVIARYPLEP